MEINKQELQAALTKVKPGLATKDVIEQTTSFAFMRGRVVTYNDEISISHPVPGLVDVEGAVKASALYAFLEKVKKDTITLEWEENQVVVKAGRAKAGLIFEREIRLPIEEEIINNTMEWTPLPNPEEFIDALRMCVPCASSDMSRAILTCVYVNKDGVETTDSYRIMRYNLGTAVSDTPFLLPATAARELIKYPVKDIAQSDNWAHFRTEDGTIFSSRIIMGDYPQINRLLAVDGEPFMFPITVPDILERAAIFAAGTEAFPTVVVKVADGVAEFSTKGKHGWFRETVKVQNKVAVFSFTIGIDFLGAILTTMLDCVVGKDKIRFTGANWTHIVAVWDQGSVSE